MSKMGISTIPSYCGAQIFEAVGLAPRAGRAALHRHRLAHRRHRIADDRARSARPAPRARLPGRRPTSCCRSAASTPGGATASTTCWNPETVALLQHAVRAPTATRQTYERVRRGRSTSDAAPARRRCAACSASGRRRAAASRSSEVEPAAEIVKRFSTGAMSPRLDLARGARDARDRDEPARRQVEHGRGRRGPALALRRRRLRRSAIKQVASGRFGVTIALPRRTPTSCRSRWRRARSRARAASCPATRSTTTSRSLRHSTPGVGLISPPPHHDIYSIEDLKQLIYDLRCANPRARGLGQARRRGRRRHRRRRRREGERRPRPDLRPRRRHRRVAALLDPARRASPGRSGSPRRSRRSSRNDLRSRIWRADRRPAEDRPRRRRSPRCSAPTRWASRPRR